MLIACAGCTQTPLDGRLSEAPPNNGNDGGVVPGDDAGGGTCPSDLEYFVQQISRPILETDCMTCHTSTGLAKETRFILTAPVDDTAHNINFTTLKTLAQEERDGISLILLKPTARVSHSGGERFTAGSDRHRAFLQLVERFRNPGSCAPGSEVDQCAVAGIQPGAAVLRRLTSTQYANTIRDLFAGRVEPSPAFPETVFSSGFNTFAAVNIVSATGAEQIFNAAEQVAAAATSDMPALLACTQGQAEADCVAAFVRNFGRRVLRRPLSDADFELYYALYRDQASRPTSERVAMILEAMLQSPQFLYIDEARTAPDSNGVEKLDGYSIAAKLSYYLWDTTPDPALLDLAGAGGLDTAQQVGAKALEMLNDPRAENVITSFHRDWLQLYKLDGAERDPAIYPQFNQALIDAMRGEMDRFVTSIVGGEGTFSALMTSNRSFTNQTLDMLYGSSSGSTGPSDWRETTLSSEQRGGVLSRAAFLSVNSYAAASSPIARGVFVLREMLCQELEMPPGLEITNPPDVSGETVRERLAAHRSEALCASCHDKIDPLGFGFENYDAIGRWRDQYPNNIAVDASGSGAIVGGSFDGPMELAGLIANLQAARNCYATSWYRYAAGRVENGLDQCALRALQQRFNASNGNIKDLIVGIAESDAFRYRRTPEL